MAGEVSSLKIDQVNARRLVDRFEGFVKSKSVSDITADDLEVAELVTYTQYSAEFEKLLSSLTTEP